jgi:uncharacterized membrane protein
LGFLAFLTVAALVDTGDGFVAVEMSLCEAVALVDTGDGFVAVEIALSEAVTSSVLLPLF